MALGILNSTSLFGYVIYETIEMEFGSTDGVDHNELNGFELVEISEIFETQADIFFGTAHM